MKSIFASVINQGGYDLADLLKKVDRYHIEGKLTDDEKEELYALARRSPKAQYDYADEIQKLWAEIRRLHEVVAGNTVEAPADQWPEFVQPTGAHDAYHTGTQVIYNGQHYRCLMDNCVWSPDVLPNAWEIVNEV